MKLPAFIWILLLSCLCSNAQYAVNGNISNDYSEKLKDVRLVVQSTQQVFRTDNYGIFRVVIPQMQDTLLVSLKGYEPLKFKIACSDDYVELKLKMLPSEASLRKNRLASLIKGKNAKNLNWTVGNESYSALIENPVVPVQDLPVVAFSANNNMASYSNVRRFLNMDELVPPDALRIEEVMNYFNFLYKEPPLSQTFAGQSLLTTCPWNPMKHLLWVNASARKVDMSKSPPNNIVLLIDNSGSMDKPNKIGLLKTGIKQMVNQMRPIDTISVVAYGSTVSVLIEGASGNDKKKIIAAIEKLQPSGPTPGAEGIIEAYRVVNKNLIPGGNNRIILASDGDFNVGVTTEKQLEELIDNQKKQGVYLTCLGVGMGNYKDSKLSILAYKGNGNFSYIDNDLEAEKVLVSEISQTLFSVASNVHLVANFNPLLVKDYRLIGYDNNKAALADTASRLMGGEIGSGHSLAAVFELTLQPDGLQNRKVIADMRVNYQVPNSTKNAFISFNCPNSLTPLAFADSNYKRAVTLLMFSMKLKSSECMAHFSWKELQTMAHLNFKESSNYLYREFSNLVDLAKKLYTSRKGRKELRGD